MQFLNRLSFVSEIVAEHRFFPAAVQALCDMLAPVLDDPLCITHVECCQHRRYNPILADLRVVFSIPCVPRRFVAESLDALLELYSRLQRINPQTRALLVHVDYESRDWIACFNLHLGLCGMFEALCGWTTSGDARAETEEACTGAVGGRVVLSSAERFLSTVLARTLQWQESCAPKQAASPDIQHAQLLQPDGSVEVFYPFLNSRREDAAVHGEHSFHFFLHRLLAFAVQESCKNPSMVDCLRSLEVVATGDVPLRGLRPSAVGGDAAMEISPLLVDFPLDCLAWAAEIRVGLWRRNGMNINDQLMNVSSPSPPLPPPLSSSLNLIAPHP